MRAKLHVSLVPFLIFSALQLPFHMAQGETARVMAGGSVPALPPGQQLFLENGAALLPIEPRLDLRVEQAVRAQLDKPAGPLADQDLGSVTSLTLPAGLRSAGELWRLTGLTDLTLEHGSDYGQDFLLALVGHIPSLKRLTLKGPNDLPTVPSAQTTEQMPLRLETAHAIFLGDAGMSMSQLVRYASFLEDRAIAGLERDTGLRPQALKPVLLLYGDQEHWTRAAGTGTFWGYYSAREQRIHMAHWKTPGAINTILLTHELFHWLAWEEGRVDLPTWLNEGLAHNLSWRIELRTDGWVNPFAQREWLRVINRPEDPVPDLATHRDQDQYTVSAVAYMLQTRGREALVTFFALTNSGVPFETAFTKAFGATPAAYETEFRSVVQKQREGS